MTSRRSRRASHALPALALTLLVAASACRDGAWVPPTGATSAASITPRLIVTQESGGTAVVTIALDVTSGLGKFGSFTGRLHFEPAALAYDGEVTVADNTVRASNRVGDVIRVAGISTAGVDATHLAAFRFKVMNAGALGRLRFDLEEVHTLSRTSALALVRSPGTVVEP